MGGAEEAPTQISSRTRSKTIHAKGMHLDGCLKKATSASKRIRFESKEQVRLVETQYPTYRPDQLRWSNRHLENNWKYAFKKEQQGTAWWLDPDEFSYEICYGEKEKSKDARQMIIDVGSTDMLLCVGAYQIQHDDIFMFQRTILMPGPKKVVRKLLPHVPEQQSSASDSENSDDGFYDELDFEPVYDSDEPPNEDKWNSDESVHSGVVELVEKSCIMLDESEETEEQMEARVMGEYHMGITRADEAMAEAEQIESKICCRFRKRKNPLLI